MPFVNVLTVRDVPVAVSVRVSEVAVFVMRIRYPLMVAPFADDGANQDRSTFALPGVAATARGVFGRPFACTEVTAPKPRAAFVTTVTRTKVVAPAVSPVSVAVVVSPDELIVGVTVVQELPLWLVSTI